MLTEYLNSFEVNNLKKLKKLTTELLKAIHCDKLEEIKQFITEGADVNAVDKDGYTPLHYVFLPYGNIPSFTKPFTKDSVAIVSALIGAGANVNAVVDVRKEPNVLDSIMISGSFSDQYRTEAIRMLICYILLKNPAAGKNNLLINFDQVELIDLHNYLSACSTYWDKCKTEILSLEKITFNRVSLLNFYTIKNIDTIENVNKLALMSRNDNIKEIINEPNFIEKYPIFGSKIKEKFEQGLERNKHLTTALNSFFRNNGNAKLNEDCSSELLEYLDKESLKNVTQVASLFFRSTPSDDRRADITQTNHFLFKP